MILGYLQRFDEWITETMEKVAEGKNKWNDFTALHSFSISIVCTIGVLVFGYLAINADYQVLQGMFYNSTGDKSMSHTKAILFSVSIFFCIMLGSGKVFYITNRKLHKEKCLDENDKLVKNEKYKYNRSMLWMYSCLMGLPLLATLFLTFNTDQIIKAKSNDVLGVIEEKAEKRDTINLNRTERKLVSIQRTFANDSISLYRSTWDEIKGTCNAYPDYKSIKEQINNWKILAKSGSAAERKEAPRSIALLNKRLLTIKRKLDKQAAPILAKRANRLSELSTDRNNKINVVYDLSTKRDSMNIDQTGNAFEGLSQSSITAGTVMIGMNIFYNIVNVILSRLIVLFYIGANIGRTPKERERADQDNSKSASVPSVPKSSKKAKSKRSSKPLKAAGTGPYATKGTGTGVSGTDKKEEKKERVIKASVPVSGTDKSYCANTECGTGFKPRTATQRFCSGKCRTEQWKRDNNRTLYQKKSKK